MRHRFTLLRAVLASLALACAARGVETDFNHDIRPIIAGHCLKCHGLDESARKSKLRLDTRATATGPAKSGKPAIVPARPEQSELVRRVFSDDPEVTMPPPSAHLPLSDSERNLLRQWIAEGATYQTHWAFVAPRQAPLPPVARSEWPRNPIDRFVLAKLESHGLRPSPEADRYTLIRRVYLDLIGVPPTPREADEFLSDSAPDAYEKLVDKLLANPHYGERWARRWLDVARYADTNGFEKDRPRTIWPYRDWVIHALNADMPFDQFTVEQIAGDMLPHATSDQKIATGFHRNTMLNEEGGIDPLEYRFLAMVDRVNTTGTAWLGLTIGCAQCHTHKYDPITQKEYYRFMACLDNADEPQFEIPDERIAARRAEIESKIEAMTSSLPESFSVDESTNDDEPIELRRRQSFERAFQEWEKSASAKAVHWVVLRPDHVESSKPFLTALPDGSILAGGDVAKSVTYDLTFHPELPGITALRLEVLPDDSLPNHGPGMVFYEGQPGDFFLSEIALQVDGKPAKFNRATQDVGPSAAAAIDGDPQTGWSIGNAQGSTHVAAFSLAEPTKEAREITLHMLFERYFAAPLGHFLISVTTDSHGAQVEAMPSDVEAALASPSDQRTETQRAVLLRYFVSIAPRLAEARKPIEALRAAMPRLTTTLVMRERPVGHSRPTYVHHRGEFLQPEEQVEPGVPAFLPPLPNGAQPNRLSFARWLVSADNPLTARVQANRQWAAFFGRGIVRTLQDFGYQGEPPANQELLDWLAVEFMKNGWSLKRLDRMIVTSATYRQDSRVSESLLARDPENELLARGPRFRLEAELIRDSALAAARLLSEKLGGPSVFPPQPASVTTEGAYGALPWNPSTGEDRFRRSLYTFSKRTAPFALYNTFDAPSGEACIARREVSDSPLQALSLLNDAVFVEAARAMGRTVAGSSSSDEVRAADVFRRCLARPPDRRELRLLIDFARHQRRRFASMAPDAMKVAGPGDMDPIERATWTAVSRAVMNLDETVTKN